MKECTNEDCEREFETEQGMKIHRGHTHGPNTVECARCGEEFACKPADVNGRNQCKPCWDEHGMLEETLNEYWRISGEEARAYKGGYVHGLSIAEWENLCQKILDKYDQQCVICGMLNSEHKEMTGRRLSVHHIDGDESHHDEARLRPYCQSCHVKEHLDRGDMEDFRLGGPA